MCPVRPLRTARPRPPRRHPVPPPREHHAPDHRRGHRGRPGRADRRLPPVQARRPRHRPGGRPDLRRRHLPHGPVQRLPLRHRRPPVLLEVEGGRGLLDRNPPRRHARPAAVQPHLLQREVLRLPAEGRRGAGQARPRRVGPVRAVVPEGPGLSAQKPEELRGLGDEPVRLAALQHLLQDLHREGVGDELQGDLRRLGRPADQGAVAEDRRPQRPLEAEAEDQGGGDQDADQHLPLPAARPRDALGGVRRQDQGPGGRGPHGPQGGRAALRRAEPAVGGQPHRPRRRLRATDRRARHQLRPDAATGAGPLPAGVRRRAGGRRQAAVPRLPDGGPDPAGQGSVLRQLDLHPRPRGEGRPHPELQVVVAAHGPGPGAELLRPGILLLRGGRPLGVGRPGPGRAGQDRAGEDRAGKAGGCPGRVRGPAAEGVPGLRRPLRGPRRDDPPGIGRPVPEPAPGRAERDAQVQQPGPRDDDGDAVRGQHPGRPAGLRPVGGQPGRRVPRERQGGRAGRGDRSAGGPDAGEGEGRDQGDGRGVAAKRGSSSTFRSRTATAAAPPAGTGRRTSPTTPRSAPGPPPARSASTPAGCGHPGTRSR